MGDIKVRTGDSDVVALTVSWAKDMLFGTFSLLRKLAESRMTVL